MKIMRIATLKTASDLRAYLAESGVDLGCDESICGSSRSTSGAGPGVSHTSRFSGRQRPMANK